MTSTYSGQTDQAQAGFTVRRGRSFRVAFYSIYIACTTGANFVILVPRTAVHEFGSNTAFQASWIVLHGLSLAVFISLLGEQSPRNLAFVAAVGAFILGSAAWSVTPGNTLIYGGMLVGNIAVAHLMASELSLPEIAVLLTRILVIMAFLGIVAYWLSYGAVVYLDIHQRPNIFGGVPLRGFFGHKVMGSLFATLGAVGTLATTRGIRRIAYVAILGFFVTLTGSATGIILFVLALVIYPTVVLLVKKKLRTVDFVLNLGVLLVLSTIILNSTWERILTALGRDVTLTGRTYLWNYGLYVWRERPILGWGYDAYLNSPHASLINSTIRAIGDYDVPHFHQSFVQTAVDLGALGVALLAFILGYIFIASYRYAVAAENAIGVFAFVTTFVMVIASTSMYLFFDYNHFATFLLFLVFFALRRAAEEPRREALL